MDMNNDELIRKFLTDNAPKAEDNGFSERVMRRIPPYTPVWLKIGKIVLPFILALVAICCFDLWSIICNGLINVIQFVAYAKHTAINPLVIIALLGLAAFSIDKIRAFR